MSHTLKSKKEEIIMRKRKVRITVLGVVSSFIIAVWLLAPATSAIAKTEKFKCRIISQIAKIHRIEVGDVEGHIIAIYERRGLQFSDDGEVGSYVNWITSDTINEKGTFEGYNRVTYEDGSTVDAKFQGTSEPLEGGRSTGKGTFSYIGGSGRFEGIKGSGSFTYKTITPYTKDETKSDLIADSTGTRTLPSK
jgi:hypothetical protein